MEETFQAICRIENVAGSVVREYLYRKGYTKTLYTLECEMPRDADSICNRAVLLHELHIEKLFKKNKASNIPFRTILEIIVKDLLERPSQQKSNLKPTETSKTNRKSKFSSQDLKISGYTTVLQTELVSGSNTCQNNSFVDEIINNQEKLNKQDSQADCLFSGEHEDKDSNSKSENCHNIIATSENTGTDKKQNLANEHDHGKFQAWQNQITQPSIVSSPNPRERRRLRTNNIASRITRSSQCIEINGISPIGIQPIIHDNAPDSLKTEQETSKNNTRYLKMNPLRRSSSTNFFSSFIPDLSCSRPITVNEACELRLLLFGNTEKEFGPEWTEQGFAFQKEPPMTYGIIQKKAGPCGVLAAVQAYVLQELLFGDREIPLIEGSLQPDSDATSEALARAMTDILWQAGEKAQAVVALKSDSIVLDGSVIPNILKQDGVLEYIVLHVFNAEDYLLSFLYSLIQEFIKEDSGSCVTFLYSVILTRGIDRIKEEMDNPKNNLIGEDGYCSQEVVNLLLVGRAVQNVFDGDVELKTGGTEKMILHGIPGASKIGQLSLYEYQHTFEVGNFYKNPTSPIWLIHGENHFTVLFATTKDVFNKTKKGDFFDLFFYDGLAKQKEEICLFIEPSSTRELVPDTEDDYLPAVERCLRTRWKTATVTWKN